MPDLLTTPQVSDLLGVSETNIRTAKSRNKDRLTEPNHWIKTEDNRTLWTSEGVTILRSLLCPDTEALQVSNGSVTSADTDLLQLGNGSVTGASIDELLQAPADAVAFHLIESRFPSLVHASIHRILSDPSDLDAQRLAAVFDRIGQSLGLLKLSSAFAGGLRHALKTSAESLQAAGLPVPSSSAHLLEGGNQDD